ncbi:MAG: hypothetical protein IPO30_03520 [Hyphomonadaceae bacterium]|nr:hypothetical protein [Hyphomonadaceae bacterium]MBP9233533.1 hypothetical protein [Hyphomonadaceae bacterium]
MPYFYTRRPQEHSPCSGRAIAEIIACLNRVLALQDRLEDFAGRGAPFNVSIADHLFPTASQPTARPHPRA